MRIRSLTTAITVAVVVLVNSLAGPAARADHCPDELIIPGPPEHRLAGIDATKDRIERVVKLFGKSEEVHEFEDSSYPPGGGEVEYTWSLGDAKLKVLTIYHRDPDGKKIEAVQAVMVKGLSGPGRLQTGRRIGLGATRDRVVLAYGSTYLKGSLTGAGSDAATITFCFADETGLEFTFDDTDRVVQLYLAPSSE